MAKCRELLSQALFRCCQSTNVTIVKRKYVNVKFTLDKRSLHNRVLKFRGNYEDEVKNFFKENPVSYQRVKERQKKLLEKYTDLDIDDYFRNGVRNNRIIIESRIRKSDLPLIYVMNEAGTKKLISEVEEEDLLCMDIRVLDENVNEIKQVIAILMIYLEYPIRTKRLLCIQEQRRLVSVFRQLTS